jgi:hypothetical protein
MQSRRFRFTIGQLIKLVAVSALAFATLRTPIWPIILAIGPIMPGFSIDRARGGPGILGSMLAGVITFVIFGGAVLVYDYYTVRMIAYDSPAPFFILLAFGVGGLAYGTVVGCLAFGIMLLLGHAVRPVDGPPTELLGPIVWRGFEDRAIPHPQAGGRGP